MTRMIDETTASSPAARKVETPRREELLERAESIILEEGFVDLTMDKLAGRLRCSKSTLYAVANGKRELVTLVVRRFFERATRAIEESTVAEIDHRRKVKVYLRGVGRHMSQHSLAFYQDMVAYRPAAEIYTVNSHAAARRVRSLIEAGVAAGQFRAVDAAFAAEVVVLAIEGVRSGRLLERTGLNAGEAFAEIGDLILDGLQDANPR